jgi:ankyrin repeat protein
LLGAGRDRLVGEGFKWNETLMSKVLENDWSTVEGLLISGADTRITNNRGFTALHFASYYGYVEVARTLIANGRAGLVDQTTPGDISCL